MENTITVRSARNHDVERLFLFMCKLENQFFDKEEFLQNYQTCMSGKNNIYLVAVGADNTAIGFIGCHGQLLLHHGGVVYEIQEFFVDPDYRYKGVGKLLLHRLEEKLSTRKWESLEVSIRKWRMEARQFYSGNGFEQTHLKFSKKPSQQH